MNKINWSIDPAHSEIGFKVKHMMFTNVYGRFESFDGEAKTDENGEIIHDIIFTANVQSINTGNADRDKHLKGTDFFDTEKYPKMYFKSIALQSKDDGNFHLIGNLTIRDITKQVALSVENNGIMVDPWGNTKMGLNVTGKINRKDWGLTWNTVLEGGGLLVSEDINLNIEVQLVKQK